MDRGKRTVIVLGIALLAALGASYAAYEGMQRMAARSAASQYVAVVVAARPVPVGTPLTAEDVRTIDWPIAALVDGALQKPEDALGRAAVVHLATNEPITDVKLGARGSGSGLSPTIPTGMRAISIRVNEVVGVGGFIVPGSRVVIEGMADTLRVLRARLRVNVAQLEGVDMAAAARKGTAPPPAPLGFGETVKKRTGPKLPSDTLRRKPGDPQR